MRVFTLMLALSIAFPVFAKDRHRHEKKPGAYYDMEWAREQRKIELEEKQLDELRKQRREEREREYDRRRKER